MAIIAITAVYIAKRQISLFSNRELSNIKQFAYSLDSLRIVFIVGAGIVLFYTLISKGEELITLYQLNFEEKTAMYVTIIALSVIFSLVVSMTLVFAERDITNRMAKKQLHIVPFLLWLTLVSIEFVGTYEFLLYLNSQQIQAKEKLYKPNKNELYILEQKKRAYNQVNNQIEKGDYPLNEKGMKALKTLNGWCRIRHLTCSTQKAVLANSRAIAEAKLRAKAMNLLKDIQAIQNKIGSKKEQVIKKLEEKHNQEKSFALKFAVYVVVIEMFLSIGRMVLIGIREEEEKEISIPQAIPTANNTSTIGLGDKEKEDLVRQVWIDTYQELLDKGELTSSFKPHIGIGRMVSLCKEKNPNFTQSKSGAKGKDFQEMIKRIGKEVREDYLSKITSYDTEAV